MVTKPVTATDASFAEETASGLTLVDFWAPWCGSCGVTGPTIEQLAEHYADQVKVVQVNVDENPQLKETFGIQGVPTLLLLRDGVVVDDLTARHSRRAVSDALEQHLLH